MHFQSNFLFRYHFSKHTLFLEILPYSFKTVSRYLVTVSLQHISDNASPVGRPHKYLQMPNDTLTGMAKEHPENWLNELGS